MNERQAALVAQLAELVGDLAQTLEIPAAAHEADQLARAIAASADGR